MEATHQGGKASIRSIKKESRKEGHCIQDERCVFSKKKTTFVGNDVMSMLDQVTAFASFSILSR